MTFGNIYLDFICFTPGKNGTVVIRKSINMVNRMTQTMLKRNCGRGFVILQFILGMAMRLYLPMHIDAHHGHWPSLIHTIAMIKIIIHHLASSCLDDVDVSVDQAASSRLNNYQDDDDDDDGDDDDDDDRDASNDA